MKFGIPKKGALIIALWIALAALAPILLFWNRLGIAWLFGYFVLAVTFFGYLLLRTFQYEIALQGDQLRIQRGVLIKTNLQLSLQFVLSLFILQTPLQKYTHTCLIIIRTAGSSILVAGLTYEDAQKLELAARLAGGSRHA